MDVERVAPALYERLGARASTDLAVLLDVVRQEWASEVTTASIDRFERRLTVEVGSVRVALAQVEGTLRTEIAGVRTEMHDGDAGLRQEMSQGLATLRQEMHDGDAALRQEMSQGLAALRQEVRDGDVMLRQEFLNARNDLLKWAFAFWTGQVIAVGGLMAAMLRLAG